MSPFILSFVTSAVTVSDIGFYILWQFYFIVTINFNDHKNFCIVVWQLIQTNGTDWHRGKQVIALCISACDVSFYHLWHWFLPLVIFGSFCDKSFYRLINRMAHRQISYVSLYPTYCDICCYPLWHWFLHLVTFFSIVTIVFTNNEISYLSLWQSI